MPNDDEMNWLRAQYPDTFEKHYEPRFRHFRDQEAAGNAFHNGSLPMLCQTCQIPMFFTEPGDPTTICFRETEYKGDKYHFCSDGCKDIFAYEPEKYIQAWLPVHQIYQGNCGGAELGDVLKWYHVENGEDNGEYFSSKDHDMWSEWRAEQSRAG